MLSQGYTYASVLPDRFVPSKAVDGSFGTTWFPDTVQNRWEYLTVGSNNFVGAYYITTYYAYAANGTVKGNLCFQYSYDGSTWTTAENVNGFTSNSPNGWTSQTSSYYKLAVPEEARNAPYWRFGVCTTYGNLSYPFCMGIQEIQVTKKSN